MHHEMKHFFVSRKLKEHPNETFILNKSASAFWESSQPCHSAEAKWHFDAYELQIKSSGVHKDP